MDKNLIKECLREILAEDQAAAGKEKESTHKVTAEEKAHIKDQIKIQLSKEKVSKLTGVKGTIETEDMEITLKLLCEKLGIDCKAARKALRESNVKHDGHTWVWKGQVPEEILAVLIKLIAA